MPNKIYKAIKQPQIIIPYLLNCWYSFFLSRRIKQVTKVIIDGEVFYKYKGVLYPEYLNNGNACAFIIERAKKYCKGIGIDVGADIWPFPGAIPILNDAGQNAYRLDSFEDNSLDYVFSSHCLEHLNKWQKALRLWIKKLKPEGILFLYLPHKSMELWRRGEPWVGYAHAWVPDVDTVSSFLVKNNMKIIAADTGKDKYWSFCVIASKNA